jgi:hypothetical protein
MSLPIGPSVRPSVQNMKTHRIINFKMVKEWDKDFFKSTDILWNCNWLPHSGQNGIIVSAILIKIAPELKMF